MSTALSKSIRNILLVLLLSGGFVFFLHKPILTEIGEFLVRTDTPVPAEAAVVLSTGIEYYPRLIESARLYKKGLANKVVINGNRKSEALRKLEKQGFKRTCSWHETPVGILEFLGVPKEKVLAINAEDAYDTVSEANIVGNALAARGISKIIVTTSKFHTRRAGHIWRAAFSERFEIQTVAARDDPFQTDGWWKSGRQVRQLLAEYGAWLYYYWKKK